MKRTQRQMHQPDPGTRGESDDDHCLVVARFNARWRVIECRDGIHRAVWRGRSYLQPRDAIRRCVHFAGEIAPAALAILTALSKNMGGLVLGTDNVRGSAS